MTDSRTLDILGEPYYSETIDLPADGEGAVVATLVSRMATDSQADAHADSQADSQGRAVLHLHGFADYFFQTEAADYWTGRGYDFYALDLRKYGRSLLPHQTPNFVTDLADYFQEIDAAWQRVTERDGHDRVILTAHSTGGLVGPLWAHARRPALAGMVLNSPWLDLQGNLLLRTFGTKAIDQVGARRPYLAIPRAVTGLYAQSLHKDHYGEWDFNLEWKPLESWPVYAGWLRAIRRGHAAVHRGIDVGAPVLVLSSAASAMPKEWGDDATMHDIVLDVAQIRKWAHKLADHVTLVKIPGALHDVTLSAPAVRERAFAEITAWHDAYLR